jgi:hypothetical protein
LLKNQNKTFKQNGKHKIHNCWRAKYAAEQTKLDSAQQTCRHKPGQVEFGPRTSSH